MAELRVYTKEANESNYPAGLAHSVHISVELDDGTCVELNKGYGMLFPCGAISETDGILAHGVVDPRIMKDEEGSYIIAGIRTAENFGSAPEDTLRERACVAWTTGDFIEFGDEEVTEFGKAYENASSAITISDEKAKALIKYWNPEETPAMTLFPKARGFADPMIFKWEDRWYFLSTNDNVNDIGLFIREADSPAALLEEDTPLHLILDVDEEKKLIQNFWAPEAHVIGGELYIMFAISPEVFGPCCYLMRYRGCGPLTNASSWETPKPMLRRDGTVLTKPEPLLTEEEEAMRPPLGERSKVNRFGISLDMTYLKAGERSYVLWSYRCGDICRDSDTGSMIMIAEIDEKEPGRLISEPVCISRPLLGFENARGTRNNEGPFAYRRDGMIHVFYSGGDARGYLYIINVLSAKEDADLLDAKSWKKRGRPLANFTTWKGIYGPGHNSWFTDDDGKEWIVFHAVDRMENKVIAVAVQGMPENIR